MLLLQTLVFLLFICLLRDKAEKTLISLKESIDLRGMQCLNKILNILDICYFIFS